MTEPARTPVDQTEAGEQRLITGVAPVTLRQKLEALAGSPGSVRRGQYVQKPCDLGLFDETARAQTDLVDLLRQRPEPSED
ncbi:hypothetical protein HK107_12140 [Parvularcula sp. ZS-1/3]|uniref:Uncharacterized protein n=1 Tax=Parvularcula mediterranea TaxID=2732508 RepID=A0A7Y3RMZ1_9PROT|nr:hypothetical protein [Parvularcula mediterranea]NNU17072.1 hypothetical protein [Parvularcula mediterranea]